MATVAESKNGKADAAERSSEVEISFVPLGEQEKIYLTLSRVKRFLCVPTRSGKMPSDEQVIKFMMLCKAQSLNPWVNDAYLTGFDTKDGPNFSLITSIQAMLKRAEASPQYDGMESGVIILNGEGVIERPGDLLLKGETLVGGWARVHRKDRKFPDYDALNLATFDKQQSRWNSDKAGMIVKCAEASALRKAFPSTLAAMLCREEMEREREHATVVQENIGSPASKADRLANRIVPALTDEKAASGIPLEFPSQEPELVPVERERGHQPEHDTSVGEENQEETRVTIDMILAWIDSATRNEFKSIESRINRELETGDFDQREVDQVTVALQERRKQLK